MHSSVGGRMLKVGLTGNIAAGKSTVAEVWRSLGATVVDADELARRAVDPGTPAFSAIAAEWGEQVGEPDGGLDRAALRRIVFADPAARELVGVQHGGAQRAPDLGHRALAGGDVAGEPHFQHASPTKLCGRALPTAAAGPPGG